MRPRAMSFYKLDGSLYPRHFVADLYLTDWMEAKGFDYDIITDEDLHREGAELLRRYRAVVTGSHPEYCSAQMLDGFESYLQGGGKLMYLGGNGFYWVTSVHSETSHAIEIRRWGGTEPWEAEPGEYYHSTTGELGGLWRRRGRAPQQLVGVGFSAVGWSARPPAVCGPNRPYKQEAGSFDPRAQFIFENVGPEELIGDFESSGLGRGAAGDEIDRADASLGTPHHALLLARASSFSGEYLPTAEEVHLAQPWLDLADKVRADMVYFECPNGGAVFSTGSVSWLSCLSHNGYENTVSRITANVMKRFVS